jgi:hypothetical protein
MEPVLATPELADWLADDVRCWAARERERYDEGLPERLAAVIARLAPRLSPGKLAILVRYSLWSILLDDRLDDPRTDAAGLRATARLVGRVIRNRRVDAENFLAAGLSEVLADLRRHDPDGTVLARCTEALIDAAGTAVEHTLLAQAIHRGAATPPTAEDYLAIASRHVNYRSFAYALLLLVCERPTGAALALLDRALVPACTAVRLANDIRSASRDRREHRLNILSLMTRDGTQVTVPAVQLQIAEQLHRHHRLLAMAPVRFPAPDSAPALVTGLRVVVDLYGNGDLREGAAS